MNTDIFEGRWNQLKGKVKQKWSEFTDDEIGKMEGKADELQGKLQEKYGLSKEQAKKEMNDFLDDNK
jgi:uncharacterized protein YjbJ (UPF0337 family)